MCHLPSPRGAPLLNAQALPTDKDYLLILGIQPLLVGLVIRRTAMQVLPHGLLQRAHPALNRGTALGRLAQISGHLALAQAGRATGLELLLLALGSKACCLVFDALAHAAVPELGKGVRHAVRRVRRMDFPVGGLRGLGVGDVHEAVLSEVEPLAQFAALDTAEDDRGSRFTVLPATPLAATLLALEERLPPLQAITSGGRPPGRLSAGLGLSREGHGGLGGCGIVLLVVVDGNGERGASAASNGGDTQGLEGGDGPGIDVDTRGGLGVIGLGVAIGGLLGRGVLRWWRDGAVDGHDAQV